MRGDEVLKSSALFLHRYHLLRGLVPKHPGRIASGRPTETISADLKGQRGCLAAERDRFVAKTIDETLKEGETVVLFMGAYHKEVEKVGAYFRELLSGRNQARLKQLALYLTTLIPTCRS